MGPEATEAAPALTRAMEEDTPLRTEAAGALWSITRDADLVLPTLIDALERGYKGEHVGAAKVLDEMGPHGKPAIPALIDRLQDTDESLPDMCALPGMCVGHSMAFALGSMGEEAASAVLPIADAIDQMPIVGPYGEPLCDYDPYFHALFQIGAPAMPVLRSLLLHEDSEIRSGAANAIKAIESAAAARDSR
jgi:HEAT repeat protein